MFRFSHSSHTRSSYFRIDESSQDSMAWSAQSSQEECPEDFVTPNRTDYGNCHYLMPLGVAINIREPRQYKWVWVHAKYPLSMCICVYVCYNIPRYMYNYISVVMLLSVTHRAAALFCKLSGLLTSYGLYQVVLHEQLALYCRGSTASFSARMVLVDPATGTGKGSCTYWIVTSCMLKLAR